MSRLALALAAMMVVAVVAASAEPATAAPTKLLRLNGIGPLHLGMTRGAALRTGWLTNRRTGCPLGGRPLPITYRLAGSRAPSGIRGTAEFRNGRLRNLTFTRGVRTARGVTVGRTRLNRMVARYRRASRGRFTSSARFIDTFQGTFVTVRHRGRQVLGGFGRGRRVTTLAIPAVPVCE